MTKETRTRNEQKCLGVLAREPTRLWRHPEYVVFFFNDSTERLNQRIDVVKEITQNVSMEITKCKL